MQKILAHSCAGTSVSHFDTKEATKTFWSLSHRSRDAGGVTPSLGGAGVPGAGGGEHSCSPCLVLPELYWCCSVVTGVGVLPGREGELLGPEKDLSLLG